MPREFADDKKKKKPAKAEAAPEPPAKPPEDKPPVPTAEELEARATEVMGSLFPKPGKKPEPPPEPPKPEPVVEPEAEIQPEPTPEPEKPKKPLPPPIAEALKPEQLEAPPAKPDPRPAPADFTQEDEETIAALARMEKDGKADRGIVDRTKRFWKDEADYIAAWQKVNPGETFDAEAEAHAEFYDKNEPLYDEREFTRTKRLLEREEDRRINKEELKKETEAETYERQMREHAPRVAAAVSDAITQMTAEAGFKEAVTKDGKLALTKEAEAEIDKANPHARAILIDEAQLLAAQVAEIDKFEAFPDKYKVDQNLSVKVGNGAYINPHRMLMDFAVGLEAEIAALPPEETVRNGKRFVTQDAYSQQIDRIWSSQASEEAKVRASRQLSESYYTLGWEDIKTALVVKHATQARAKIDRFGGVPRASTEPSGQKTALPAKPAAPPESRGSNKAPSVSSASDNVDTAKKGSAQIGKTPEQVVQSMWG